MSGIGVFVVTSSHMAAASQRILLPGDTPEARGRGSRGARVREGGGGGFTKFLLYIIV